MVKSEANVVMYFSAGGGGYNAAPAQSTYGAPSGGRYNAGGQNNYSSNTGGGYGGPAGF